MSAWTVHFDPPEAGTGLRVAVKDAIDVAGVVTTAGCVPVRDAAVAAAADAACLAGIRAAGARLVGKTTLTELCWNPTGINEAFGTPANPRAPDRIPGGSSSGSAVVVAAGQADVALGTDTGGSVRIPAACCGVTGLKTTWGRIPTTGVWPLAPSLDTVGPIARDMAGVVAGMQLLEPGWRCADTPARTVGRLRLEGVDPAIEAAIDAALDHAGLSIQEIQLPGWEACWQAYRPLVDGEFWRSNQALRDAPGLSTATNASLHRAREADLPGCDETAREGQRAWQQEVAAALRECPLLALPTLMFPPARLTEADGFPATALTAPFNLAGVPALALPVPAPDLPVPASLQLVAAAGEEDLLCATGLAVEAALGGTG